MSRRVEGLFVCEACGIAEEGSVPVGDLTATCSKCHCTSHRASVALPPSDTDVFGCTCGSILHIAGVEGLYCAACGEFVTYSEMSKLLRPKLN